MKSPQNAVASLDDQAFLALFALWASWPSRSHRRRFCRNHGNPFALAADFAPANGIKEVFRIKQPYALL